MSKIPAHIRPAEVSDVGFIMSSWVESFKESMPMCIVPSKIYFTKQKELVRRIITKADCLVACNEDDYEQLFGFCCYERIMDCNLIHYVYTKGLYRNMGVCEALMNEVIGDSIVNVATHQTKYFQQLAEKHSIIYNPFLLYGGHYGT